MAEPENHTIRLLQDIRHQGDQMRKDIEGLAQRVDSGFSDVKKRMDSLQQAVNGESVLGRYAVAEVEERLSKIEQRLSSLEERR
jgi:uncharacterized protein YoxC